MLYSERPSIPQTRLRCRHPRCGALLKTPASDPRDAFCCRACEVGFYRVRCRVCEQLFTRKTKRRVVCWREKCRSQFKRHSEDFFGASYPSSPVAHNEEKNSTISGLKTTRKSGRGYRVIAGPAAGLEPINFTNPPEMRRTPGRVLITRTTPPVNVIGGYRFPGAPPIDLGRNPPHQEPESTS